MSTIGERDVLSPLMGSLTTEPSAQTGQTYTFEVAWEVCNKVGGIYTVIKTKTAETVKQLGEHYCLIGPYVEATAKLQFEEIETNVPLPMAATIAAMQEQGVKVHFGRWLIDGAPKVVLFEIESCGDRLEEWRKVLWEQTKIGFPDDDNESKNATLFGFLTAWFLGEYHHQLETHRINVALIAHFHEWLAGIGLVLIRMRKLSVATVFTTHATLLGRYLCADSKIDFYNHMSSFDPDKEAGDRGIYHRYCIERASAYAAHIFTTVSQITADEAEHLLKRRPDIITPNGLNSYKFTALHEFQTMHAGAKEKIEKFVHGHFHGHLDFDLDNTLYFFLAGRYEYRNKGCDLYLEALGRLNRKLQQQDSKTTVVAFIIMPAKTNSYNVESLRGQAVTKRLVDTVAEIKAKIGDKLYAEISRGLLPNVNELIDKADMVKLKRCVYTIQEGSQTPPITTHNIIDDDKDEVLSNLRRIKLFNQRTDRVKVVFHPEFLSSSSPLLPLDYEEFVRGCHLGVFPSYYEPWGYTPAECTVMGVPSITSNLSGFGCFIEEEVADPASYGIFIVDRRFKSPEESVSQLTSYMMQYCGFNRRQRVNLRNRCERLSELLGWESLAQYYTVARKWAVAKVFPDLARAEPSTRAGVNHWDRSITPDRPAPRVAPVARGSWINETAPRRGPRGDPRRDSERFNPKSEDLSDSVVPPSQWTMDPGPHSV
eukprot:m.27774 g.27774  ORF g.27774 m.27774 type:complete len:710 (+) comp15807_c0_seq1:91-2220(+)